MTVSYELDLNSFRAWSGAKSTLERIQRESKCEALENELDMIYPEGMTETQLNDLLWFEPDYCYELVGLRTETQINDEIQEKKDRLQEIEEEFDEWENDEDLTPEELEANKADYQEEIEVLNNELVELKEELAEL